MKQNILLKKIIAHALILSVISACFFPGITRAAGTMKAAAILEPGKTYSYDLDKNGKKEKIKYTCKENEETEKRLQELRAEREALGTEADEETAQEFEQKRTEIIARSYEITIYINGKKSVAFYTADSESSLNICDVDDKDGAMDIFAMSSYACISEDYSFMKWYQYKKGKISEKKVPTDYYQKLKIKNANVTFHGFGDMSSDLMGPDYEKANLLTDGKGKMQIGLCIFIKWLGYIHVEANMTMKNGKLKDSSAKKFEILGSDAGKFLKSVPAFTSAGGKKKAFQIKKGTAFGGYQGDLTLMNFIIKNGKGYVEVNYKGKKGWLSTGQYQNDIISADSIVTAGGSHV